MPKVVIQAGHINCQYNSITALRTSTGAPGEQEFTLRIANKLSELLRGKGFTVKQTDANANDDKTITGVDWDFFLAIHYEADVHGTGGGMITAPDPAYDNVNDKSKAIVDFIRKTYYAPYTQDTGIVEQPNWVSVNMTKYYMWNALSGPTPCGIIECGVGKNAHDSVILADTDRVANAIAKGLCKAFNVAWETPPPTVDYKALYEADELKIKDLNTQMTQVVADKTALADKLSKAKSKATEIVNL